MLKNCQVVLKSKYSSFNFCFSINVSKIWCFLNQWSTIWCFHGIGVLLIGVLKFGVYIFGVLNLVFTYSAFVLTLTFKIDGWTDVLMEMSESTKR
jgi:hypothetical protein